MKFVFLGLLLVGGCAHQTPEQRAAERERRDRCARVELYPMGVTPPRPYRVLGPVSAWNEANQARREQVLQEDACALGADAVIDVKVETTQENASAGTAVAYIADPPPQTQ